MVLVWGPHSVLFRAYSWLCNQRHYMVVIRDHHIGWSNSNQIVMKQLPACCTINPHPKRHSFKIFTYCLVLTWSFLNAHHYSHIDVE